MCAASSDPPVRKSSTVDSKGVREVTKPSLVGAKMVYGPSGPSSTSYSLENCTQEGEEEGGTSLHLSTCHQYIGS